MVMAVMGHGSYQEFKRISAQNKGRDGGVMNVMIAIRFDDFPAFQVNL